MASKVLLATGLVDELPELAGLEPLYGVPRITVSTAYAGNPVAA
jgi:hypothetical protein